MDIEIKNGPGNATARVTINPGETLTTEGGAMIAMSANVDIQTTTHKKSGKRNLLKAVKRLLSGESFFVNHFTAKNTPGQVWLATTLSGDMMEYQLQNENLIVQGGSFVGCEHHVNVDLGWQGFKSIFSGESVFWIHLTGQGKVILNSFGAIYPIQVDGEYIVDTGHIVAFNDTLNFNISKAGKSWLSSFFGGEGFVCRFTGKGTVWCQSHNKTGFGKVLGPLLKPR